MLTPSSPVQSCITSTAVKMDHVWDIVAMSHQNMSLLLYLKSGRINTNTLLFFDAPISDAVIWENILPLLLLPPILFNLENNKERGLKRCALTVSLPLHRVQI